MANPELVQALDYILNRSDEAAVEVLAEAVVRRRRSKHMLSAAGVFPNPEKMAQQISEQITKGVGGGLEAMRSSVQEMVMRIISEHAPELNEKQTEELCRAWLPGKSELSNKSSDQIPREVLIFMIEQFVAFSTGNMKKSTDNSLREEMGDWPEKYWKSFPPLICSILRDYLKGKTTDKEFNSKLSIALDM